MRAPNHTQAMAHRRAAAAHRTAADAAEQPGYAAAARTAREESRRAADRDYGAGAEALGYAAGIERGDLDTVDAHHAAATIHDRRAAQEIV